MKSKYGQCPKCKNNNVKFEIDFDGGDVSFYSNCMRCGFNKCVNIPYDYLTCYLKFFFRFTHYDWFNNNNIDDFIGTYLEYPQGKYVPYDKALDAYDEDNVKAFRYSEYGEE